jgi:hypothetical protein
VEARFVVGAVPVQGTGVTGAGSSWSGTRGSSLALIPGCAALSAAAAGTGTGGGAGSGARGVVGCASGWRGGGGRRGRGVALAVNSFGGTYTIITVLAADAVGDCISGDVMERRPRRSARATAMAWAAALVSQYRGAVRASPRRSSCAFGGVRRRRGSGALSRGSGSPRLNRARCMVGRPRRHNSPARLTGVPCPRDPGRRPVSGPESGRPSRRDDARRPPASGRLAIGCIAWPGPCRAAS